jgi:hypothetical protein
MKNITVLESPYVFGLEQPSEDIMIKYKERSKKKNNKLKT